MTTDRPPPRPVTDASAQPATNTRLETHTDPVDGTIWHIDTTFVDSHWTCLWGRGCPGMLDHPAPELGQGCCSAGAELIDDDEAMTIEALGLTLEAELFANHAAAAADGVLVASVDGQRRHTRVLNGACIFHNPPDHPGGAGCALHLAALAEGESPMDWKPTICWQMPFRVDDHGDGERTLRAFTRTDWGDGGTDMAWWCTEHTPTDADRPTAFVGEAPVAITMHDELRGLVGPEIAVELRRRHER